MSLVDFKKGFNLMDRIIIELVNLNKFSTIKDVTFLYFGCENLERLEYLRSHPLTKNIIVVSDIKFSRNNVISMRKETWETDKEKLLNLTKNCVVINENKELALEETYSFLGMCSKYYPIVLLYSNKKLSKTEIKKKGFSSHIGNEIFCNINIKLKEFKQYNTDNFQDIKKLIKNTEDLSSLEKEDIPSVKEEGFPVTIKTQISPRRFDNSSSEEEFIFLNGVKSPTVKNVLDKYNVPSSKKWRQEFYEYLKDLMGRIFPKDKLKLIDIILNNDTLRENWIPCFTHFTANPNTGKNYEAIETIGDVTLGYCFKFYIKQRDPLIDQSRLSNLNQKYMSKVFQSKVAKKMKLHEWLISCGITADRMDNNEDLLEAFCGTIDQLLYEKSEKIGLGVVINYNFIKLLFDNVTFETEEKENTDPDRTYVDQLFSGQVFRQPVKKHYTILKRPKEINEELWEKIVKNMNIDFLEPEGIHNVIVKRDTTDHPGIVNDTKVNKSGKITITISILKEYASIARKLGIDIPNKEIIIGQTTRSVKKIAEKEAYSQAKEYVVNKGMTKEWKESLKKKNKNMILENIDKVLIKAQKRYPEAINVSIERPKTMKVNGVDCVVYQIVGEDKEGKKFSIFTLPSQDKAYEQEVINEYLIS